MKKLLTTLLSLQFILTLACAVYAVDPPGYVGSKHCRACHAKKYKSWRETRMADSFENLKPGVKTDVKKALGVEDKDYTSDPQCLKCHTTGYGEGGFTGIEETPDLAGITCEACHGPGRNYRKGKIMQNRDAAVAAGMIIPTEEGCLSCHTGDSPFVKGKTFNFSDRSKKSHDHSTKK